MDSSIQIVKKSQVFLWEDGASSITFTAETPTLLTTLGQIQIVIDTTLYQLSKGNVMFLRPNDAITVEYNEDTAPLVYQVGFEYYELVEYTEENIRYGKNHDHLPPSGWMTEFLPYQAYVLIQKIVEQYQPVQSAQNSQCRFLLDELLHIVFSQKRDIRKHHGIPSIEKALFYIQEHYHTPITTLNAWIQKTTSKKPNKVMSGYSLDGKVLPKADFNSMAYTAPFAVSAMIDSKNQDWLNKLWTHMASSSTKSNEYFDNSIRLLTMITASGNWWLPE
ncbi:hypothetical protein [Brevibacillus laterosporus]|uniref:Uncharacterized protein n=1 Tax=Brevibacillus laterosporus TaxID=1465 RepID=A0AAP3DES8_BRELA|nr:hypothetical protein [Brevibacillus laterosporus]MCR8979969.1 hypothetical protein [Brevibacillus laterosporus]MCZ0807124.1 hypothetical protein [Brevibacillus laterosporus]MCZ0826558.1 hypothetical protein [Brevibacillus laterosporus]MCZ0850371.1 hypothetical protein [Brevibacillus laterosporus]